MAILYWLEISIVLWLHNNLSTEFYNSWNSNISISSTPSLLDSKILLDFINGKYRDQWHHCNNLKEDILIFTHKKQRNNKWDKKDIRTLASSWRHWSIFNHIFNLPITKQKKIFIEKFLTIYVPLLHNGNF